MIPILIAAIFLLSPQQTSAYSVGSYYSVGAYYSQSTYYSQSYYQGYYQSYYQGTYQTTFTADVTVTDDLSVVSQISKSSGTFVIDHPLDPLNKLLYHSFVESPDAKNFYDGIATLDGEGGAAVELPAYFEALNKDFRYQLRPIGKPMPNLHIQEEIKGNRFSIGGGEPGGRVSWQVTGTRHDAYILANPIIPEVKKSEATLVGPGEYLFEGYAGQEGFFSQLWRALTSFF